MQVLSTSTAPSPLFDEIAQTSYIVIQNEKVQSIAAPIFYFFNSTSYQIISILTSTLTLFSSYTLSTLDPLRLVTSILPFSLYAISELVKCISYLGLSTPQENLEKYTCPRQISTSSIHEFETVQIRALASLEIDTDIEKIETLLCSLLCSCQYPNIHFAHNEKFINRGLNEFSHEQLIGALSYFGITLNPKEWNTLLSKGKIKDLRNIIFENKQHGMYPRQYYTCMKKVLSNFLTSNDSNLTKQQKTLLRNFSEQTSNCYRLNQSKWASIHLKFYYHQREPKNELYREDLLKSITHFANSTANAIDLQSKNELGYLFEGGWAGHFIQTEIKKEGNKYLLQVANAGSGAVKFHDPSDNWNPFRYPEYIVTKTFEIPNRDKLIDVLETLITAKTRKQHVFFSGADEYYSAFNGLKERIYTDAIARPVQRVGNCGFRNQEELLFAILQRNGEADLANRIQYSMVNLYQNYPHLYAALKYTIQQQKDDIYTSALKPMVKERDMDSYRLEVFHANTSLRRAFINEI
jgi:hypothetical protein